MSIARFLTLVGGIALMAVAAALWVMQGVHERNVAGQETILLRPSAASPGGWAVLPTGTARTPGDAQVLIEFAIAHDPLPAPRSRQIRPPRTAYVSCALRRDPPSSMRLESLPPEAREKAVKEFETAIENPQTLGVLADEVYRRNGISDQAAAVRAAGQVVEISAGMKWGAYALLLLGVLGVVVAAKLPSRLNWS